MSDDNRVDVSINVSSDGAEQGASKAADSLSRAIGMIQRDLRELVSQSRASTAALTAGFAGMSGAAQGMASRMTSSVQTVSTAMAAQGSAATAVSRAVQQANAAEEESHRRLGHTSVAARRELLVLGHELAMGNYKRFVGSLMVLGEQMDWMGKIMSPAGMGIGLVAAEIAALAAAAIHGAVQMNQFRESLVLTGNYAGLTAGRFIEMGNAIQQSTGSSIGSARDALAAVAASGRFTGAALQPVAEAVASIGKYSKAAADEVVKAFERMDDGVYKFAVEYNKSYHFATNAQLEHIRALEEQGQKERAEVEVAELVRQKQEQIAVQVGQLPGILHDVANAWHHFWDEAAGLGRGVTVEDRIANLKQQIGSAKPFYDLMPQGEAADKLELRRLQQQRDRAEGAAGNVAASEGIQRRGTDAMIALRSEWKGLGGDVKLANDEIARFRRTIDDAKAAAKDSGSPIPEDIKAMIARQPQIEAEIRKRYDSHDFKKAAGGITAMHDYSYENAQTQARLNALREDLKAEQAELDRAYKQQQISLQGYYQQRLAITLRGMDAERDALKRQLDQTKALEARAATPAERLSMRTKEVEIEGRLTVMERQRTAAVTQSSQEMQAAIAAETKGLEDLAAKRANAGFSQAQQRALMVAEEEVKQGRMTQAQLIELQRQFEQKKTEIAIQAIQHRLDTEKSLTKVQQQELRDQQLQLAQDGQTKQLQLAIAANDAQMQSARQAATSIEEGFSRTFASIIDGTARGKQAFANLFASINQELTQLVTKSLFDKISKIEFGGGFSADSLLRSGTSKLLGGDASGAAATTAHTTAVTADTTGIAAMTAAVTEATAALAAFTAAAITSSVSGAGSSLSGLLGGLGQGDMAGAFGFTATGVTGSAGAVASGAMSSGGGGMSALMGLASYDVGTPFVPNDMIAQIHQGEAIIPAHLNSPYNPGNVNVSNQFVLPGGTDLRTQSQIAAMAGASISQAMRRNG
ncbi:MULTISPECIES: phage tail length tape measure family protein [unclassified Burkholderia]|uniref:phage tail length tape measure family protein n=1 Tax=unclassified Burkholderia TaxID=2613784 RepID=UPI002AAF6086|nr:MULTISPECIES: phage tail length tape measure family protein [unclassified Burkholderia]